MKNENPTLVFGLEDKPALGISFVAGLQHFLAVFGGIVTAPLIIAEGMGLSVADTSYLVTSALLISGCATLLQITRVGVFGSGLLSIQGTSFTFIGPILFAFASLPEGLTDHQRLATIFGTSAICAIVVMPLCYYISKLQRIFTPNVTGATILLIGITLVWTTLKNLARAYHQAEATNDGWSVVVLAVVVFSITFVMAFSKNLWLRLGSITTGLLVGFVLALMAGQVDFDLLRELDTTFLPEPLKFGMRFDWGVLLIMLPVFFVTATESIGDLTATCSLSRQPLSGPSYWLRVKGGLLGDALNSLVAVCFATFPNTTFSQNNGVIRLTGIASRKVGYFVAGLLILIGFFPVVGGLFQIIPGAVIYATTLLMFGMVAFAGINIVKRGGLSVRSVGIVSVAVATGLLLSLVAKTIPGLPDAVTMFLAFPISTGAITAMVLELLWPKTVSLSVEPA